MASGENMAKTKPPIAPRATGFVLKAAELNIYDSGVFVYMKRLTNEPS